MRAPALSRQQARPEALRRVPPSGPVVCFSWRLGIATAWTLGHDRLQVFENGIGAINLPYTLSQYS